MASTNVVKINCIALIVCIALCAPVHSMAPATFPCCDVKPALDACKHYAMHGGARVPQDCCYEALNLKNNIIDSHHHTIAACHCIQDAAKKLPHINATAFSSIPEGCGILLPFNFRLDMNCERYNILSYMINYRIALIKCIEYSF